MLFAFISFIHKVCLMWAQPVGGGPRTMTTAEDTGDKGRDPGIEEVRRPYPHMGGLAADCAH